MFRFAQFVALLSALLIPATWTSPAQACTCLPPDVTSSYSNHDDVFTGRVLEAIRLGRDHVAYRVRARKTYKGCLAASEIVWVISTASSASCGLQLAVGQVYLLNASATSWPGVLRANSCGYNVQVTSLTDRDMEFLDGRMVCCGNECTCADGTEPVECLVDPCEVAPPCRDGECVANYCGGCNAEFFDSAGYLVCTDQTCESDEDCYDVEFCSSGDVCLEDGECKSDVDCNLPGNEYPHIECVGHGVCTDAGECGWDCGPGPECVDYAGYDFGPCDAVLGWGVVDGKCTEISGCSAPLGPLFASEEKCRETCERSCDAP